MNKQYIKRDGEGVTILKGLLKYINVNTVVVGTLPRERITYGEEKTNHINAQKTSLARVF